MAEAKRLLILTRDRANAAFRQRIEPYLAPLGARGIACEVVEVARCPLARRGQMAQARGFDGVLVHRKTLTYWDARALRGARRLLYDFDDAVMVQARAPDRPHAGRLRRFRRTMARADLVIAGSRILAEHAYAAGARRVAIVPTGLDASRLRSKATWAAAPGRTRLVWIGSASTLRQLEPFRPMFEALGRTVPGLILRVIADANLDVPGLAVENVRWRLEDEAHLLAESDLGIAPLPDTPFTRGKCGFKVLQYMAAGLPVVASPVGVNADYVRHGETGLWARSAEEWVEAVGRLAGDAALRERMGREGRGRIEREFDFAVLAPGVCDAVAQALA